ncbi:hypothetical protein RchiOBHm_Chr2g0124291 [Rosa chinensis]|uniref:Uncharacterized protein n=1 Tax=Rosa chinensis TaxID=74649 RepID=A0A2P6RTB6_ROSCH|nr:hypothetical protein RchiOBHm_Chr2g0124291 [Rosa chinensis]
MALCRMHCKVLARRFWILGSCLAWCITSLLFRSVLSITRSSLEMPTWILHRASEYQCNQFDFAQLVS